jgi:hypothetical protein
MAWVKLFGETSCYKSVRALEKLLMAVLTRGPNAIKRWSHDVRKVAVGQARNLPGKFMIRNKVTEHVMLASTLGRAVCFRTSESAGVRAQKELINLWYEEPRAVSEQTESDLERFLVKMARSVKTKNGDDVLTVIPNKKSCLEVSAKNGGVKHALVITYAVRYYLSRSPRQDPTECLYDIHHKPARSTREPWQRRNLKAEILSAYAEFRDLARTKTHLPEWWLLRVYVQAIFRMGIMARDQAGDRHLWQTKEDDVPTSRTFRRLWTAALNIVAREYPQRGGKTSIEWLRKRVEDVVDPDVSQLLEMCQALQTEDTSLQPLKTVAIPEKGGKIRVATTHPAHETVLARLLMARFIPKLKGWVTTRRALRDEEIIIDRSSANSRIYSADLSKATDRIGHKLARQVWKVLCVRLREPTWVHETGYRLLGPKMGPCGPTTTSLHLGLGISWIVLSVLNTFCAHQAGASKDTYAICGDDLVGFWDRKLASRYEEQLSRCGLVANLEKSFYSKHGVFCEKLVQNQGDTARVVDTGRLSQIHGSVMKSHLTRKSQRLKARAQFLTGLPSTTLGQAIARQNKITAKGVRNGPVPLGGNGASRTPTPEQLLHSTRLGPVSDHSVLDEWKDIREGIGTSASLTRAGAYTTSLSDVMIRVHENASWTTSSGDKALGPQLRMRNAKVKKKITPKLLLKTIRSSQRSSRLFKRVAWRILHGAGQLSSRTKRRLGKAMVHKPERYVKEELLPERQHIRLQRYLAGEVVVPPPTEDR